MARERDHGRRRLVCPAAESYAGTADAIPAPDLAGFAPFEHARLANPQTLDRDGLVAFYASMGWIGDLLPSVCRCSTECARG